MGKNKNKKLKPFNYVREIPNPMPEGQVLVHNFVIAQMPIGTNGFRAWLSEPKPEHVRCDCGWAADIGDHYIISR